MKRKCAIKETTELEIQLKDKVYTMLFSNSLFIQYEEEFGNLADTFNKAIGGITTCEFYAKLMYCYFKFIGEEMSLIDCKTLIVKGGDGIIQAMTECLVESIMLSDNEEVKKKVASMNKELFAMQNL